MEVSLLYGDFKPLHQKCYLTTKHCISPKTENNLSMTPFQVLMRPDNRWLYKVHS